jgi:protein-S-isoprenylcysteine O-methyltransferase Ste14
MVKLISKLPVLLVAIFVSLMYVIDAADIVSDLSFGYQTIISLLIFLLGTLLIAIGGYSFYKAKTTVNPMVPEKATSLVTTGFYNYSRNPMYLGSLGWLLAFVIFFGNLLNILLLPIFVYLVNRLYIHKEEHALEELFGDEFRAYKTRVRRWI